MEKAIHNKKWFQWETDYIDALDGIRILAILVVLWFHFWQQTWLMPYYPTPFLRWLGVEALDLNVFRRCGYLCVDMMILLSGFVLFLPLARNRFEGTPIDSVGAFYKKRLARIVPSYLFAVLVMFFVAFFDGAYANKTTFLWKDLVTHLTFTFLFFQDTYQFSAINGVFWTAAIEVLFYAVFPLLRKPFLKRPLLTYLLMTAVGLGFTFGFCLKRTDISFMVNRFLTFFPVFANGMLCAYGYVWFVKKAPAKPVFSLLGTLAAVGAFIWIVRLFQSSASSEHIQVWQLTYRYVLSIAFSLFVFGIIISARPIRAPFSNRVMRSAAAVSYNLYLWHQFLIVRLRMAFGCNYGGDVAALGAQTQWMLNMEALILSFAVAILLTYCLEKPLHQLILHGPKSFCRKGKEIA